MENNDIKGDKILIENKHIGAPEYLVYRINNTLFD